MKQLMFLFFFCALLPRISHSEQPKVSWVNTFAYVAVPGEVTHGDSLQFIMKNNNCDYLHHLFSSYTFSKHPKILELKNTKVPITINGINHEAEVVSVKPFLMGHLAMLSIGYFPAKDYISFISKNPKYEIVISDNLTFIAHDYFDIPNNSWNLTGLVPAIEQAQKLCIEKSNTIIKKGIASIVFNLD